MSAEDYRIAAAAREHYLKHRISEIVEDEGCDYYTAKKKKAEQEWDWNWS